jgi:hypothetical protein
MHSERWSVNVMKIGHSEDISIDGRIILEWMLEDK